MYAIAIRQTFRRTITKQNNKILAIHLDAGIPVFKVNIVREVAHENNESQTCIFSKSDPIYRIHSNYSDKQAWTSSKATAPRL